MSNTKGEQPQSGTRLDRGRRVNQLVKIDDDNE